LPAGFRRDEMLSSANMYRRLGELRDCTHRDLH
jgi:hypothetical protein